MIYLTGDTHIPIDIRKLNSKNFPEQKTMCQDDFVIICGDFGLIWSAQEDDEERYWKKWLNNKTYTTLFVDGNHENFHRLHQYPTIPFHGGLARQISEKIYHLCRGQVFHLEDYTFFTMGGASSHDKQWRKEHISWWQEELPRDEELDLAEKNLAAHHYKVDVVLTHCAPTSLQNNIDDKYHADLLTDYLEQLRSKLDYKHWYFGHYHQDKNFDQKHHCLYQQIRPLPFYQ